MRPCSTDTRHAIVQQQKKDSRRTRSGCDCQVQDSGLKPWERPKLQVWRFGGRKLWRTKNEAHVSRRAAKNNETRRPEDDQEQQENTLYKKEEEEREESASRIKKEQPHWTFSSPHDLRCLLFYLTRGAPDCR